MTLSQQLRLHLTVEHDVDAATTRSVGLDELFALHAAAHDHRGSVHHVSHSGIEVESRATRDVRWHVVIDCQSKRHAEEVAKHVQHVRPGDMREQLIDVHVEQSIGAAREDDVPPFSGLRADA